MNVTAIEVGVGHEDEVGVGVVVPVGNAVTVTEEKVPVADEGLHCDGRSVAPDVSHGAGNWPARRALTVKKAA